MTVKLSSDAVEAGVPSESAAILASRGWKVFLAATFGYSLFYVCRLSFSVVKGPLVAEGLLTEWQLGLVGSALFYSYAVGKLVSGFLADRVSIRRFIAWSLLVSSLANLMLGFYQGFCLFLVLWAVNGWAQSAGAPCCIIALTRWFPAGKRGTFYGFWSASHNLGEGLTFVVTALVVARTGWRGGWWFSAASGLLGVAILWLFFHDGPPATARPDAASAGDEPGREAAGRNRRHLLTNPALWLVALASMCMYVSRYAINSWGIFFLENAKGYPTQEASLIVSVGSICGMAGTVASGWVSDRFFGGRRAMPTILVGLVNVVALAVFLLGPRSLVLDAGCMVAFGFSIGALLCYLGGLMAVDVAGPGATGAALGIVGIASYAGAGTQDIISGYLINANKSFAQGVVTYSFLPVSLFWIAATLLCVSFSVLFWLLSRKEAGGHRAVNRC